MYLNKILDYRLVGSVAGLQPTISTKSLLTWKLLRTSKFDTAANKQCKIYILISGRLSAWVMNSNVWPFAMAFAAMHSHSAASRKAQHSNRQNNEKLPRPKGQRNPLPIRFYYMASVNIQYLFTDCVSYKSICSVTTSTAKYAKRR